MFKLWNTQKVPAKSVDDTTVVELKNGKMVPLKSMVEVVTNAMEEEEEKNQKANMEDFVEVAGEKMSVKDLANAYEEAMSKKNAEEEEDEKENSDDEDDKENAEYDDEYEDEKENAEDEEEDEKENSEDEEDEKENAEDEEEKSNKCKTPKSKKKDYFNGMKNSIENGKEFSFENSTYETLADKVARGNSIY